MNTLLDAVFISRGSLNETDYVINSISVELLFTIVLKVFAFRQGKLGRSVYH